MALLRLASVLLLLSFGNAPATAATVDVWLKADIRIGADGRLTALDWRGQGPMHALAARRIEPKLAGWEFEPGRLNGEPVETRTGLLILVEAQDAAGGGMALRLKAARTGPVTDALVPPSYPVNAARSKIEAIMLVDLLVRPDGKAAVTDVTFEGSGGGRYRKEFVAAVERAVAAWRFLPEVVGGQALSTRLRMPIDFCVEGPWCERQRARMQLADAPRGQPFAVDSAVALKTEIRDTGI